MAESTNLPVGLDQFIDKLIEEKKFVNLDSEVLAQIKKDLSVRLEERINLAILENMPETKLRSFDEVLDTADPDQVNQFVENNISDIDQVIAGALMSFRSAYLNI